MSEFLSVISFFSSMQDLTSLKSNMLRRKRRQRITAKNWRMKSISSTSARQPWRLSSLQLARKRNKKTILKKLSSYLLQGTQNCVFASDQGWKDWQNKERILQYYAFIICCCIWLLFSFLLIFLQCQHMQEWSKNVAFVFPKKKYQILREVTHGLAWRIYLCSEWRMTQFSRISHLDMQPKTEDVKDCFNILA